VPTASTEKEAEAPMQVEKGCGCVPMAGPESIVSAAAPLAVLPQALLTRQSYEPTSPEPAAMIW
jgi:hypothetical protein